MAGNGGKDTRKLLRAARRRGWTVENTGKGHLRVTNPGGDSVTLGGSPGSRRACLEERLRLRRLGLPEAGARNDDERETRA